MAAVDVTPCAGCGRRTVSADDWQRWPVLAELGLVPIAGRGRCAECLTTHPSPSPDPVDLEETR